MISLEKIDWDDAAHDHFMQIRMAESGCTPKPANAAGCETSDVGPDFYRNEVQAHGSSLIAVLENGNRVGSFILRVDGEELVLVAGAGALQGAKPFGHVTGMIEQEAREKGYRSIRMHAVRPGTKRAAESVGYVHSESVMRKGLV